VIDKTNLVDGVSTHLGTHPCSYADPTRPDRVSGVRVARSPVARHHFVTGE
jgi:hypothetical protein